jgi:N-acetylglucosaminyldiphosphoundecaprenol N-acetyl-beta-D-mannosaminyltransferase
VHAARSEPETLVLLGTPVHNVSGEQVLAWIASRVRARQPGYIVTSNLDFMLKAWLDPEFHRIHGDAGLVIPDGMPMVWISRLFGPPLKERVPGSDLVPLLAQLARDQGFSVYALGAGPGVARRAMALLEQRFPGLRVAGCESPPPGRLLEMPHEEILRRIEDARPDIALVAFGAPKQEKWIRMHLEQWSVPVALGVGGTLDFIAGVQRRAPVWIQRVGLEWLWRLSLQPRRLIRRYSANAAFLVGMLLRVFLLRLSPAGRRGPDARLPEASARGLGASTGTLRPLLKPEDAFAWLARTEPLIQGRPLVIDVFPFLWLSSLELGVLTRLASRCRQSGVRLFLSGASGRVARLLRLFRLDRFMEIPTSGSALRRALEEEAGGAARKPVRVNREGRTLHVELPAEFIGDAVREAHAEIACHLKSYPVDEIIIKGDRIAQLDISAARFLQKLCRDPANSGAPRKVRAGFSTGALEALRKDGFDPADVLEKAPAGERRAP